MRYRGLAVLPVSCLVINVAHAECSQTELTHERKDAATIESLETAWTTAFLKGDAEFERCLLSPDFTEILKNGDLEGLDGELQLALANKGKNLPIPGMPKITVHMHGDVAVAFGTSLPKIVGGKKQSMRYADYYIWEQGQWRVFFAQQSALPAENLP